MLCYNQLWFWILSHSINLVHNNILITCEFIIIANIWCIRFYCLILINDWFYTNKVKRINCVGLQGYIRINSIQWEYA